MISDPEERAWLQAAHAWPGLQAIGLVEAERQIGGRRTRECRYYLLSRALSAPAFGAAVRSHWGIENQLHWVLAMTFGEDRSRIRQGAAAHNSAVLRHIALNLLYQQPVKRLSLRARRRKAGWDEAYLLRVVRGI